MIDSLRIQSFKSIAEAELDLGQINLFIGANGSGKSNLLEALALLSAAASGKVDQATLTWRGTRSSAYYRPMLRGAASDALVSFSASSGAASYDVSLAPPEAGRKVQWEYRTEKFKDGRRVIADRSKIRKRQGLDPHAGYAALKLAETDPESTASSFLKSVAAYSIYSADTPILHGWVKDPQEREPIGLGGGRLAEAVGELRKNKRVYQKLADEFHSCVDWFAGFGALRIRDSDLEVVRNELAFLDRYFAPRKGHMSLLSANDVNEGVLYLAFLAVLGLHPLAPNCFAVENVDHGLNPLLAKRLMTALTDRILESRKKRQVFLTTHNPLVLDGLPLQDKRVRLFTVDRDNRGASVIRRFEVTEKHRDMAAKGWTLSRMWINKLIGGVPDV